MLGALSGWRPWRLQPPQQQASTLLLWLKSTLTTREFQCAWDCLSGSLLGLLWATFNVPRAQSESGLASGAGVAPGVKALVSILLHCADPDRRGVARGHVNSDGQVSLFTSECRAHSLIIQILDIVPQFEVVVRGDTIEVTDSDLCCSQSECFHVRCVRRF